MEILENFKFYEACKDALIESYGFVDLAKDKLKKSNYSHIEDDILEKNLETVKEGLGDKILNFFSKSFGGGIDKIDKIMNDMKSEEINFINSEHEAESKFYKLTDALARLRKEKASKEDQSIITVKLSKIQKLIRELVSSHNSIMDDLEKQVNVITKGSKRKSEYYNLKRAQDSVETKKMRAEMKKKLVSQEDEDDYLKSIQKILGTPEDAKKDLEKAKDDLANEKGKIGASDEDETELKKKIEEILKNHKEELSEIAERTKEYANKSAERIKELEGNKKMNKGAFDAMKNSFEDKVGKVENSIENAIGKITQIKAEEGEIVKDKGKAIEYLLDIKKDASDLKYYEWPSPVDIEDQKKGIEKIIDKIESKKIPL